MPLTTKYHSADPLMTRVSLLQRARDEESDLVWSELLMFYDPFISKVLGSMGFREADLKDAHQQVAFRLWKGLKTYERDPKRAKFRTWFARLIRNTAINMISAKMREPNGASLDDEAVVISGNLTNAPEIEARVENEWQKYVVELALERARNVFSGNAVDVFTMSLEGQSVEAIAEKLSIKTNTVYILKHRVKTMLLREIQILKRDLEVIDPTDLV